MSPSAGLLAAIPVAAVLGGGVAAGDPVAGVTMGAGAMLVGIAWRTRGGRPPLGLMAIDAALMATSTFLGCVTGSTEWLHLVLLAVWSGLGGMLVALGPGGGVLGTQAVMAAVVFGRFSEPAPAALGIAAYVLAGGAAQVILLTVVRWPTPLQAQRQATATAYRMLAGLASASDGRSAVAAGSALDAAEATLVAPALLGDSALITLRTLVNEGQRIRIQIAAIHALLRQGAASAGAEPDARALLLVCDAALQQAALAITGDAIALTQIERSPIDLTYPIPNDGQVDPAVPEATGDAQLFRRFAAIAGQLRAVATLARAAATGGGLWSRRPIRHGRSVRVQVRTSLAALRANASIESPAGRHALRLAAVVVIAEVLARHLPLQRSYWMVVAAATTLRPEFGATFTRGSERLLGTAVGVTLAGLIAEALHPAGGVIVGLVAVLGWAAYSVFPASFAAGFGFITALVVFLLDVINPDTLATAEARLLDTLVGGALGLAAYALWPTWARTSADRALADLVAAQRAYLNGVMGVLIAGDAAHDAHLRPLARRARLARTRAEATVAQSLSEPNTRRVDADRSRGALGMTRRMVGAIHVVRLDASELAREPLPGLTALSHGLDALLAIVEARVRDPVPEPMRAAALPDLRSAWLAWARTVPEGDEVGRTLVSTFDEIVDAANGLAAVVGIEPA